MKNKLEGISRRSMLASTAAAGVWGAIPVPLCSMQPPRAPQPPFIPTDGENKPMGEGKGIFPGRVAWVHNPEVATWDGVTERLAVKSATGEWWDDANCNPKITDAMFSTALQNVTGKKSNNDAWETLFRHFNKTRGFKEAGYQPGEKIAIKINQNFDRSNTQPWISGRGMHSPQLVHSMLRGLVQAGVPGKDITLFDGADGRYFSDEIFARIKGDPDPRLHEITFQVSPNRAANGRPSVVADTTDPIKFSDADLITKIGVAYQPVCVVEAKYRINMAALRGHSICGVTLCAKNNNGSIYWPESNYWGPRVYHGYIAKNRGIPAYNAFVDIMAHRQIGGKGLLYIIDGLYAAGQSETNVVRWESFGDQWTASLFMSQDPVAIDSVGLDFIRNEPREEGVHGAGHPDNFLHEAALIGNPPSGTKYNPHKDGAFNEKSLGVHEHWNNVKEKKYSRNLGKKEGIELVPLKAKSLS